MDKSDEYRHLYAEIGRNAQIAQNVFVANVAVTTGIFGFGLTSEYGPIFLAPFAIIVPSLFFISSQLESTTRIAAYIAVFFEKDDPEINWESRWLTLRQGGLPARRKYTFSISGLYGLLSAVCMLLALRYWNMDDIEWYIVAIVPIISLVARGIFLIVGSFSLGLAESYLAAWEQLRSVEQVRD